MAVPVESTTALTEDSGGETPYTTDVENGDSSDDDNDVSESETESEEETDKSEESRPVSSG